MVEYKAILCENYMLMRPAIWMGLAYAQRKKTDPQGNVLYEFNDIKFSNWSESPGLTERGSVVAWILDSGEN